MRGLRRTSRPELRAAILFSGAFLMVCGVVVLGLQVTRGTIFDVPTTGGGGGDVGAIPTESQRPSSPGQPVHGSTASSPSSAVVVSASLPTRGALPNGGPGQLYEADTWAEVEAKVVRPITELEPIPVIWDWARVGPCSSTAATGSGTDDAWKKVLEGIVPYLLGRVRLRAQLCVGAISDRSKVEAAVKDVLWKRAPAWRLVSIDAARGHLVVERRQRVFIFAITGGRDRRAGYVERTWGRRTPIQWYGDVWDPIIRPIVDLHPKYVKDPFDLLTFKISRIWQRVYEDFGPNATAAVPSPFEGVRSGYDWYIRLWDDNYFYEENLHAALSRLDPRSLVMAGKMGWRNMGTKTRVVYPFAGGGAGWYLSVAALAALGQSIPSAEKWFVEFRARPDIFLPHGIHDEDVFLSAWLSILGVNFTNIPGVEHVSPGKNNRQRCMEPEQLRALRWDPNYTVYFNYPGLEAVLRIEEATYAFFKPIIWHYMSPTRLIALETLLYPERVPEFAKDTPAKTAADAVKRGKACYPGVPPGPLPPRGKSLFETPVTDPPVL